MSEPIDGLFTLGKLESREVEFVSTGIPSFDEMLGGGFVKNSLILFAGRTGAGKSTILTQISGILSNRGETVLYCSGEEALPQFALRARERLKIHANPRLLVTEKMQVEFIMNVAVQRKVDVLIIDSLPTLHHEGTGAKVPVTELTDLKKNMNCAIVFVQHETKNHQVAGKSADQHMVDMVIKADPEWAMPTIRRMRMEKNRFAPIKYEMRYMLENQGIRPIGLVLHDPFNDVTLPQKAEKGGRRRK